MTTAQEVEVLTKYLTLTQLEELLASWVDAGLEDSEEVTTIKQAIKELQ